MCQHLYREPSGWAWNIPWLRKERKYMGHVLESWFRVNIMQRPTDCEVTEADTLHSWASSKSLGGALAMYLDDQMFW